MFVITAVDGGKGAKLRPLFLHQETVADLGDARFRGLQEGHACGDTHRENQSHRIASVIGRW